LKPFPLEAVFLYPEAWPEGNQAFNQQDWPLSEKAVGLAKYQVVIGSIFKLAILFLISVF